MKTALRSSQSHLNSMHEHITNLDNNTIQSSNFLEIQIGNKIIIQKIKFKALKDYTIFFLDSKDNKILIKEDAGVSRIVRFNLLIFLKFWIKNIIII